VGQIFEDIDCTETLDFYGFDVEEPQVIRLENEAQRNSICKTREIKASIV